MSDLKFIETDAGKVYDTILGDLENGVREPLYPGDERRIFGESLAQVIVSVYNSVNDACRQKMLRYARGSVLDALGENRDTPRLNPTYATTTLRFGITESMASNYHHTGRAPGDWRLRSLLPDRRHRRAICRGSHRGRGGHRRKRGRRI